MEILAPSGSLESIIPAVRMGADAIYLGAERFSARANAENFNTEQLKEAVKYCHERNVKIYMTINTLVFDEEMESALTIVKSAVEIGVDAFIVQDLGL